MEERTVKEKEKKKRNVPNAGEYGCLLSTRVGVNGHNGQVVKKVLRRQEK